MIRLILSRRNVASHSRRLSQSILPHEDCFPHSLVVLRNHKLINLKSLRELSLHDEGIKWRSPVVFGDSPFLLSAARENNLSDESHYYVLST
jgi:hypothetical protein